MMPSPSASLVTFGKKADLLSGTGGRSASFQKRSQSARQLDIMEVRALAKDEVHLESEGNSQRALQSEHANLMMRLKSREARAKAESNRDFLTQYRGVRGAPDPKSDARLDKLLRATSQRTEELHLKSEELQVESAEAERKLERATAQAITRLTEGELQAMNPFERSQRRIQEDKREEELQKIRDEAQANFVRVHRRLQNELIELRDYKVLLDEFRRLRLEKLQETLKCVSDGRRLRACVREMVRHGAQRILNRLEQAGVPLETWMREVLVNSCHLELRIEDAEGKLMRLRREALGPVKGEIQEMVGASKQERFEALCARTWENHLAANSNDPLGMSGFRSTVTHEGEDDFSATGQSFSATGQSIPSGPNAGSRSAMSLTNTKKSQFVSRVPEKLATEMAAMEVDIASVQRLLTDMRANAAAVICHQIREADKSGGRTSSKDAVEAAFRQIKLLVSEDFAKCTIKELQKSATGGKFVF